MFDTKEGSVGQWTTIKVPEGVSVQKALVGQWTTIKVPDGAWANEWPGSKPSVQKALEGRQEIHVRLEGNEVVGIIIDGTADTLWALRTVIERHLEKKEGTNERV
jgi:hypothetical protein